jgi:mannose-6-phosphate isomerase
MVSLAPRERMPASALIFEPIYKPRIWGGDRIFSFFGRTAPYAGPIGESWELADLDQDQSVVAAGPARGKSLRDLIQAWGPDLMGGVPLAAPSSPAQDPLSPADPANPSPARTREGCFPLLIKFLDARNVLSVQVHPSEQVAARLGGDVRVKHEAWYVLAAEPGAVIYHGLEPGVDAARFREAMLTDQVEGILRKVPVRPGDCYFIPSGTPHALSAGILAAEVQTLSDTTYRAYDWGRLDPATHSPRPLHLDQAIECIDFDAPSPPPAQNRSHVVSLWTAVTRLVECPAFVIELVRMVEGIEQQIPYAEPVVWIVLEGEGQVLWERGQSLPFGRGDVLLLPARLPDAHVRITTATRWLEVTVPVRSDLAGYPRPAPEDMRTVSPGGGLVQISPPRC